MIHCLRAFVWLDCRSSESSDDQFNITHTTLKINIVEEMSRTHIKMYLPLPWGWHAGGCWRRWETWLLFYLSETEKEWHSFRIQRLKVRTQLAKVQQKLVVSLWVGGLLETPRCSSSPNSGGRASRPELDITFIHMWEWRFLTMALSLWLFWRKCIFCVSWGDFHSAPPNLAVFLCFRHVLCYQKLLLTS